MFFSSFSILKQLLAMLKNKGGHNMKGVIKKTVLVVAGIVVVFTTVFASGIIYSHIKEEKQTEVDKVRLSAVGEVPDEISVQIAPSDMLENALESVVGISSADATKLKSGETSWFMGSGVLVSDDGYIVTNHHVIGARPQRIVVTLSNGKKMEGKTVWSDAALDLAVVKIDGRGYTHCAMGDAKTLRVGEGVVAIGNPLSEQFERTVTAGIVSALGRSISMEDEKGDSYYMEDLIQTDASINPGNSGGPLLRLGGEVVGINTIKVSSAEAMGFAVPINVCVPIIERLRSVGKFDTPYLGLYAYTPTAARYFGNEDNIEKGLYVAKLDSHGPAFAAGIRYGDVITAINRVEVNTMLELREELYKRQGGETVSIDFIRDGSLRRITVMLG